MSTDAHPAPSPDHGDLLGPLTDWVGTWRGTGHGDYPTIAGFDYTEEVVLGATGKPVLSYVQRTRATDGRPLHAESGWIRLVAADADQPRHAGPVVVEWVVAQPTGLVEAAAGTLHDGVLDVVSVPQRTPSAVEVVDVRRRFHLAEDRLTYDLWMTTAEVTTRTHHLAASLERVVG